MMRVQRIVISVVVYSDLGILLLLRARPFAEFRDGDSNAQPGVGLWELPGGGLDFGETPSEAGTREMLEETGIVLDKRDLKFRTCCAYTLKNVRCQSHRVHVVYETRLNTPQQVRQSEEHAAYRWLRDLDEVRKLPMIAEIRDVIIRNPASTCT